jgi:hypothetical protein
MTVPTIVARRPVIAGDKQLTVSTIRIAADYYDTVIFDDSPNKQHAGMLLGGYVIDHSSKRAGDRETAMGNHRDALIACRKEEPQEIADSSRDWDETPAEAARFDRWWGDRDINRDEN